jgi:hypothetical protein
MSVASILTLAVAGSLALVEAPPAEGPAVAKAPASQPEEPKFLRVKDENAGAVSLEVAVVTFERPDAAAPRVSLVGVAHIGDASLYDRLQKVLDAHDLVLYESVMPPGAMGPSGETDEERAASTLAAMRFVAAVGTAYQKSKGRYPARADELTEFAAETDSRLRTWVANALTDAWGRPITITASSRFTAEAAVTTFEIESLGADGVLGGDGVNDDLTVDASDASQFAGINEGDSLQEDLAAALGLEFQLSAVDYDRPNWRCADMTADQLEREFHKRGADFSLLQGTLAGSSFSAKIVKGLLTLVRLADAMFEGAITDGFKVAMIEMLGNESMVELSLEQLGPGVAEVLIDERNQVVMEAFDQAVREEPQIKSIAIFYGAGHLPDFAKRLEALGYKATQTQWIPAITVDVASSKLTRRDMLQLRKMIRDAVRQATRAR